MVNQSIHSVVNMLNFVLGKHEANVSITKQTLCSLTVVVKGPLWRGQKSEALLPGVSDFSPLQCRFFHENGPEAPFIDSLSLATQLIS